MTGSKKTVRKLMLQVLSGLALPCDPGQQEFLGIPFVDRGLTIGVKSLFLTNKTMGHDFGGWTTSPKVPYLYRYEHGKNRLFSLCGYLDLERFQSDYESLINDEIQKDTLKRQLYWTESIAVGDKDSIGDMNSAFGALARGRSIKPDDDKYMIQEELIPYNAVFDTEKCNLRTNNSYNWNTSL